MFNHFHFGSWCMVNSHICLLKGPFSSSQPPPVQIASSEDKEIIQGICILPCGLHTEWLQDYIHHCLPHILTSHVLSFHKSSYC